MTIEKYEYLRLQTILSDAQDQTWKFTPWELSFIESWTEKLEKYRHNVDLSEKQEAIFKRLEEKLESK